MLKTAFEFSNCNLEPDKISVEIPLEKQKKIEFRKRKRFEIERYIRCAFERQPQCSFIKSLYESPSIQYEINPMRSI